MRLVDSYGSQDVHALHALHPLLHSAYGLGFAVSQPISNWVTMQPFHRFSGLSLYNEQKAAQIAAWFLARAGGAMAHLKLMKLMYLADREAMRTSGFPMTGDRFVSMPHGPVLSNTLSHINDDAFSCDGGWDSWISDKANHEVGLMREVTSHALDQISRADMSVLETTWKQFGHMSKYVLRDYTHDAANCPEWKDPNGSSNPITYKTVFEALGFPSDQAADMEAEIEAQHSIAKSLAAPLVA